jgi:hypothetical protein
MKILKKIALLLFATGLTLFFYSCNTKPEEVTERFAQHWYKGELEAAKKYATPESQNFITLIEGLQNVDDLKQMQKTIIQITKITTEETSDSTIVCRCLIKLNDKEDKVTFHLDKIDNKWLVNINR